MSLSDPLQVNIKLQQGEQSSKPIYTNFTTAQYDQGMIVIDFGFFDPRLLQAFVNVPQVDNKPLGVIDAHLSRRIVLNQDAAIQLAQQLNQLFTRNRDTKEPQSESVTVDNILPSEVQDGGPDQDKRLSGDTKNGFRFPWFKKK